MKSIPLLLLLLLLTGCSGPRKTAAAKFQKEYANMSQANSIRSTTYLGQRNGKAYLRIGAMSLITQKWSEQDFFVDLNELDPEFRRTLPIEGFSQFELWSKEQVKPDVEPQPAGD